MKYLAANTENEAKAIAHRVAFERGEVRQRLYALERRQAVLEVPDEDEDKLPSTAVLMTADEYAQHITTEALVDSLPTLPAEGEECVKDRVYNYLDEPLVCYQTHTRTHHDPLTTPALFGRAQGQSDPWVQPTGAHDAYPLGAIVTHNGKTWESLIANNVWEPGGVGAGALWKGI